MYAVVRKTRTDVSKIDEAVRKVQESFVPDLRSVEGFAAFYLVRGPGEDAYTFTLCQDREGVEETTRRAEAFVGRELRGIVRGPPEVVFSGEVLVESALAQGAAKEKTRKV